MVLGQISIKSVIAGFEKPKCNCSGETLVSFGLFLREKYFILVKMNKIKFQILSARNATRARYLSKASRKPFYASQVSIFNPPDHIDTALTRCCGSLLWPDCTLSPLDSILKNRRVTQSIATQNKNFYLLF